MSQKLILGILLIIGILLIVFQENVTENLRHVFADKDERPVIATLTTYSGKVRFKVPKSLRYDNVKENLKLKDQDTVSTDANSTARIVFDFGFELQVNPNSIIVIEKPKISESGAVQITFLRGDYQVVSKGASGKVVVSKDKKFQDIAGRPPLEPIKISVQETKEKVDSQKLEEKEKPVMVQERPKPKPKKKQKESLSEEYIASVVNNQKPFFTRCYAQHLRLNPDSHGQISLSFTVESTGKVTNVILINSTMNDTQLDRCTVSVVERCRFRPYEGDPVVVNYPINFD